VWHFWSFIGQILGHDLCKVFERNALGTSILETVIKHGQTERTRYGDGIWARRESLVGSLDIDAFTFVFFHPHTPTTRTTTETLSFV
jgi:hypothetical protein